MNEMPIRWSNLDIRPLRAPSASQVSQEDQTVVSNRQKRKKPFYERQLMTSNYKTKRSARRADMASAQEGT